MPYDPRMSSGMPARRLYLVLAVGVVAVGWAAIFIRLADAPALSIAAWRLVLGAAPLAATAAMRRREEIARLQRRSWGLLVGSGVALALHFATWIASLDRTTVASSVALVTTQPLWVALIAAVALGERMTRLGLIGMLVALAGTVAIAGVDIDVSGRALVGDLLAVAGAIFAAIYFVLGRGVRRTLSLSAYVGVVYSVAAVALVPAALLAGQPLTGFDPETWLAIAAMALVSQIVGHSALNWALAYMSAAGVSIAILGEPLISTVLAVPILGEWPGVPRVAGGLVTLAGVALALRGEARTAEPAEL